MPSPRGVRRWPYGCYAWRPYDGRRVTLREDRGGWRFAGVTGICTRVAADARSMAIRIEHDPESYWPVGREILAELGDGTYAEFHEGT